MSGNACLSTIFVSEVKQMKDFTILALALIIMGFIVVYGRRVKEL